MAAAAVHRGWGAAGAVGMVTLASVADQTVVRLLAAETSKE